MKSLVSVLGAVVIALVGASGYLTWQLAIERSRVEQIASRLADLQSRLQRAERQHPVARETLASATAPAPGSVASPGKAKNIPAPPVDTNEANEARPRMMWRDRRDRLFQSPSSRALLRADRIARLKANYPELARALGLTEAQGEELLAFLADQELGREMQAVKNRQNGATTVDFAAALAQERRELAARLGEERLRKYEAYKSGIEDRAQVRSFRTRLGDSDALTDEQSDGLALALQDERERYAQEISDSLGGQATFTMGSATGRSYMTNLPSADEDAQERQINEQMETYTRRANERAAGLLTPRQLKVFEELQAAQLTSDRLMIRSMRDTPPRK